MTDDAPKTITALECATAERDAPCPASQLRDVIYIRASAPELAALVEAMRESAKRIGELGDDLSYFRGPTLDLMPRKAFGIMKGLDAALAAWDALTRTDGAAE